MNLANWSLSASCSTPKLHTPTMDSPSPIQVGDAVDLPGQLYGTARFVGELQDKEGIYIGAELDPAFAGKGKNDGELDGVRYSTSK